MTVFNASKAKSHFYEMLARADEEGPIQIYHRNGRQYVLTPAPMDMAFEGHFKPSRRLSMLDVVANWQSYLHD